MSALSPSEPPQPIATGEQERKGERHPQHQPYRHRFAD